MRAKKITTQRSLHEGDKIGTARPQSNRNFSLTVGAVLKIMAALIFAAFVYKISLH
jgi:hypothetical protein